MKYKKGKNKCSACGAPISEHGTKPCTLTRYVEENNDGETKAVRELQKNP